MHLSVFHIRLKNFEIQAERMLDATLRTRAVAITSSHHQNGTIVCLSPEAEEEGLFAGMKVSLARKMSHSAQLLPYNTSLYRRMNQYLYHTISTFSPVVEPAGFGRFYADMTGMESLYKSRRQTGYRISREIRSRINLKSQIGIGANKLVSQISTHVVPEPIYEVERGSEPQFLAPLPSHILPVSQEKPVKRILDFLFLQKVRNIQEVVTHQQAGAILFGSHYPRLSMESHGEDTSIVQPPRLRDHIMAQKVLSSDTNDEAILHAVVQELAEQAAFRMRSRRKIAGSISLEIFYSDGYRSMRKGSLISNDNHSVTVMCLKLFRQANFRRNRIRSILVDATRLRLTADQLNLFEDPITESHALSAAMDRIRGKFGFDAVKPLAALAC